MAANTAAESWRNIRSLRADPPVTLHDVLKVGSRRDVFQAGLEQAQQQFTAAAQIGYASRPLNLFYGLAQAGRAVAAASDQLRGNHPTGNQKQWQGNKHGLTFTTGTVVSAELFGSEVTVQPNLSDLFSRVSLAVGSPTDMGSVSLGQILSQIPEFVAEFGTINQWLPQLEVPGFSTAYPKLGGPKALAVLLPGIPATGSIADTDVRAVTAHYPALRDFPVFHSLSGEVDRPATSGPVELSVLMDDLVLNRTGTAWVPQDTSLYRRQEYVFPAVGDSARPVQPLMAWWLVLYSLSMVARYSPRAWMGLWRSRPARSRPNSNSSSIPPSIRSRTFSQKPSRPSTRYQPLKFAPCRFRRRVPFPRRLTVPNMTWHEREVR
ncbi:YaaC family protein [Frondihabitans sp. PAMC 28766]|uniref:YaaC family protein n=1 Tax=Frondihabitans sp. PAMC 28766 TaxID=1795630 RepID=UPI0012FFC2B2|nr:YaaC family protein [Frondihabitans sp. PAMC 28766]